MTMYLLLLMCICVVLNFYYESISQYRGTKMADGANEKQLKSWEKHAMKIRIGLEQKEEHL